jgi:hypothetical protein
MIAQHDFDSREYHLRVMIEQMEREGRSEHAIEDAVRDASDLRPTAEPHPIVYETPGAGAVRRLLTRRHGS